MAVVKITFDGSSVSALQDAQFNHFICGNISAGILSGLGSELSYHVSNNYITFDDGYVQVYGRRVYIEAGTQVYISLDSVRYGYIVLDINLSTNTATLERLEGISTYPSLIQNNLSIGGTRYQFAIAKYYKSTSSISLQSLDRMMIPTPLSQAQSGYFDALSFVRNNYRVTNIITPTSKSGSTYRWNLSSYRISKCVIFANVENNNILTLPGPFLSSNSIFTIYYRAGTTDRQLIGEWMPGNILLLNTNSTSININAITLIVLGD